MTRQLRRSQPAVARQACAGCARGHGVPGTHQMARQACPGSENGPGGITSPTLRWCGVPVGSGRGFRSMQNTAIGAVRAGRAVLRMPYMLSTARPRRIGSVVALCMPRAPRAAPGGNQHPTSDAPPLNPGSPLHRPRGNQHPTSGARRYPPPVHARTHQRDHPTGRGRGAVVVANKPKQAAIRWGSAPASPSPRRSDAATTPTAPCTAPRRSPPRACVAPTAARALRAARGRAGRSRGTCA